MSELWLLVSGEAKGRSRFFWENLQEVFFGQALPARPPFPRDLSPYRRVFFLCFSVMSPTSSARLFLELRFDPPSPLTDAYCGCSFRKKVPSFVAGSEAYGSSFFRGGVFSPCCLPWQISVRGFFMSPLVHACLSPPFGSGITESPSTGELKTFPRGL